jgi:hypothetical protein
MSVDFYKAATPTRLGNVELALFWAGRWLDGANIEEIAPHLLAKVLARMVKSRSVNIYEFSARSDCKAFFAGTIRALVSMEI